MLSSCPVPPAAGQQFIPENHAEYAAGDCGGELTAVRDGYGALIEYLDQVVDHRSRQGLRYELGFLLAVVVAATACAGQTRWPRRPSGPRTPPWGCCGRWAPSPTR